MRRRTSRTSGAGRHRVQLAAPYYYYYYYYYYYTRRSSAAELSRALYS